MKIYHFTDLELAELTRKHAASSAHEYAYRGANMSGWQPHDWVLAALRDLADRAQRITEDRIEAIERDPDLPPQIPLPLEPQAFSGGPAGMPFTEWLKEMVFEGLKTGFEAARGERPSKEWRDRLRILAAGIVTPSRVARGAPCAKCGEQDYQIKAGSNTLECARCWTPVSTGGAAPPDPRTLPNHCKVCGVAQDIGSCSHWIGKP